ncbi:META domain-containing protein [Glaciihabitans arcticus]|uniref:META domain-containing protein n=1 Tax=Glaciihabitans arcticus TaxID=2668039 RepID=A0A4Q9GY69_9MICO|nr:META domain-containing protein [Glaciihabitans arcticus]TBN57230.1 META domain-containing protein [Glaciihabitans arcticus]
MRRSIIALAIVGALALTGCGPTGEGFPDNGGPTADPSELDGDWQLADGEDAQGVFDLKESVSTITLTGPRTGGRTSCNIFGATVNVNGDEINVAPGAVTEAACEDPDLMTLEWRYLAALEEVTNHEVDGETLTLSGGDVILIFDAVPDVPISEFSGTIWRLEGLVTGAGADGSTASPVGTGGIVFNKDGTVTGNGGCSDFTGQWEVSGGVVVVTALVFEDTDCPNDLVAQEKHVATALGTGFTPLIEGDRLTIFPATGKLGLVYRNSASSSA